MNLKRSMFDACVYYYINLMKLIIVAIFVDDIVIFSNSIDFIQQFEGNLHRIFSVKDLGPIKKCLGIDVVRNRQKGTIKLCQSNYIDNILARFGMQDCKEVSTPMDVSTNLNTTGPVTRTSIDKLKQISYQNAVGALMYLTQATRPDLAFAVSSVSRFNTSYEISHWEAVKRILHI